MKEDILKCNKIMTILEFMFSFKIMISHLVTTMSCRYNHLKLTNLLVGGKTEKPETFQIDGQLKLYNKPLT